MEIEKDKGKLQSSDTHLRKDGERTSGTNKETMMKGEKRKAGKCLPKSKTVPKLQIKSDRIREDINYMKELAH